MDLEFRRSQAAQCLWHSLLSGGHQHLLRVQFLLLPGGSLSGMPVCQPTAILLLPPRHSGQAGRIPQPGIPHQVAQHDREPQARCEERCPLGAFGSPQSGRGAVCVEAGGADQRPACRFRQEGPLALRPDPGVVPTGGGRAADPAEVRQHGRGAGRACRRDLEQIARGFPSRGVSCRDPDPGAHRAPRQPGRSPCRTAGRVLQTPQPLGIGRISTETRTDQRGDLRPRQAVSELPEGSGREFADGYREGAFRDRFAARPRALRRPASCTVCGSIGTISA